MYYCDDLPKVLMFGNFILERASITSLQLFFFVNFIKTFGKNMGWRKLIVFTSEYDTQQSGW